MPKNFHNFDFRMDVLTRIIPLLIISVSYLFFFNHSLFLSQSNFNNQVFSETMGFLLTFLAFGLVFISKQRVGNFHSFKMPNKKVFIRNTLFVVLLGVPTEEIFFNGFLLNFFLKTQSIIFSLVIVSAIFGIYHAIRLEKSFRFLILTALGEAAMGILFIGFGSLLWPIIIHSAADIGGFTSDFILSKKK